jgi:hypothetical protein
MRSGAARQIAAKAGSDCRESRLIAIRIESRPFVEAP